jgi:hypothetical protein
MASDKNNKWKAILAILLLLLVVFGVAVFGLKWFNASNQMSLAGRLSSAGHDASGLRGNPSGVTASGVADGAVDELRLLLEPLDDACIAGEEVCLDGCDTAFMGCDDGLGDCYDACDETYPYTEEIASCIDTCHATSAACVEDCGEVAYPMMADPDSSGGLAGCEADCYDTGDRCAEDCDSEYIGCSDICDDSIPSTCLEAEVDCYYTCVADCIPEDEVVTWSGGDVSDIGGFFEGNFPRFSANFDAVCETLLFGEYIATEHAFACVDYAFFGDIIIPLLHGWASAQVVCETLGGTWASGGGFVGCTV